MDHAAAVGVVKYEHHQRFSTHRVDDAQDGTSIYVEASLPEGESALCSCSKRKVTLVLTVPAASRFRHR